MVRFSPFHNWTLCVALGLPGAAAAQPAARPAAAASAVPPGNDTIERLHDKLAERLGSVRQPTTDGTLLLKVPSRPLSRERPLPSQPAAPAKAVAWAYEGPGGPAEWGRLRPEYAKCATGQRQSPIDIRDGIAVDLDPIEFEYQPGAFRVIDNGHTVQVNVARGNSITVGGRRYELQQFHFHRPAEERIAGKRFDMGAHLVHKDVEGRLAVLVVLLERGAAHPVVQQVWNNLPLEKGEEQAARQPLNPAQLLPEDRRHITYMGSMTTPPCSEGVLWLVMKQPVPVASEQIEVFGRLYPMNARPVQPTAGRMIKESR